MFESGDKHYKHSPIRILRIHSFCGFRKKGTQLSIIAIVQSTNINEKNTMQSACAWLYKGYELLINMTMSLDDIDLQRQQ